MFHLKSIELVHWDYWQRFRQTVDANIVAIVGPNGSGKTTLLDALRTLFALSCSGKRDYKRYVRHASAPYAWIRGVVDNRRVGNARHPFFPLLEDEVTLVCRIRRQGGDWHRQYLIVPGDVPIDEKLEHSADWLGVSEYRRYLEAGGLTPAIAQVLALEQGETDRLCEYPPKAILDLVFHVFGDKQVLDRYAQAKADQQAAEAELDKLEGELARVRNDHETFVQRANRYLEWRRLRDEQLRLETEIRPRVELAELARSIRGAENELSGLRRDIEDRVGAIAQEERLLARVRDRLGQAAATDSTMTAETRRLEEAYLAARDAARATAGTLDERERLRRQVLQKGEDAATVAARLESAQVELAQRIRERETVRERLADVRALTDERRTGKAGAPPFVAKFRAALDEAGIPHQLLTEIVGVTDTRWQAAVEALLAPYRHVVLLKRARDRAAAWRIGEREQYRHFVVADREPPPTGASGSVLEVVEFLAEPPAWLASWLSRVQRVEDAQAGAELPADQDWITRAGYHRERRGARHAGVPLREFQFGEAARRSQLAELETEERELVGRMRAVEEREQALRQTIAQDNAQIAGLDAALLLSARADEYAAAAIRLPHERHAEQAAKEAREEARIREREAHDAHLTLGQEVHQREADVRQRQVDLTAAQHKLDQQSDDQQKRFELQAHLRAGMPPSWYEEAALEAVLQQYGSQATVKLQLESIAAQLAQGQWETDETVLLRRDKLAADVREKTVRVESSRTECERAKAVTMAARGAYVDVLRATVRRYGNNLRELGRKAGIEVDYEMPHLENDDLVLAQAGLHVKFDFDRKGMIGLNDGEASGGQQVMKSLILLIALMMDSERPGGFVFIDEPFAHLDIMNIDRVAAFLRATQAQYLITTPSTHNLNVFSPVQLTLVTQKKRPGERWAPPVAMLRRDGDVA